MALTVKRVMLWRREDVNRPGLLAETLAPLASVGADLKVCMAYRIPGRERHAVIELAPVSGSRQQQAARQAGLAAATSIPSLIVQGDDRPGLGTALARAIAEAGIDVAFLVAQVVGERYSAVFGFPEEDDARRATAIIRKVTTAAGRAARAGARRKAPVGRRRPRKPAGRGRR